MNHTDRPTIPLKDIKIGQRFRKDLGDINKLAKNIKKTGLLHPIVLDEENNLVAGYRRIKAFEKLGEKEIPYTSISVQDIRDAEIYENTERKNFTPSEMVEIKRHYEPEIKSDAKKRMTAGKHQPSGNLPQGQTRDIIAKFAGVSGRTLEKAEKIVEAAEQDPRTFGETLAKVDSGKISINYAYDLIKRQHIHNDPPPLPEGEYDVIYADPPWKYNYKSRGAENHYPTMDILELTALEIPIAKITTIHEVTG